jgi:predicted nuclease of predicted toxin-antitoxin system
MTVVEQGLNGGPDSEVSEVCRRENRTLITLDLDFANIRSYPPVDFPGIIVLRLRTQDKQSVLAIVSRLIQMFATHPLNHHLWVVDDVAVRIRGS